MSRKLLMDDSNQTTPEPEDESGADEVERLMSECLGLKEDQRLEFLEEVRKGNPEGAETLVRRLDALRRLGIDPFRPPEDAIPERLGEFRLLHELGSGGMGVVFLAEQESLGRRVALKLIRPENLYFPSSRQRFSREVEAAARLQHPNIIPVYTVGEDQGLPFFVMEWIEGPSLAQVITALKASKNPSELLAPDLMNTVEHLSTGAPKSDLASRENIGGLRPFQTWSKACLPILIQVLDALSHAHAREVLHRDVKPSNILLTTKGRVVLVDFGLAQTMGSAVITRTGSQIGSLAYMAPEQHRGTKDLDERTDVYAMGVTLYELLTLQVPYAGDDSESLRREVLRGHPPSPRERNRAISRDLETVCLKAMAKEPEYRYQNAEEFAQDLRRVLELKPIQGSPPGRFLRARRWISRHPFLSVALMLNSLLLLAAPVYAWIQVENERLGALMARDEVMEKNFELENRQREIERLSDSQRARELLRQEESLHPATPENAVSFETWLQKTQELLSRRDLHRQEREKVRDRLAALTVPTPSLEVSLRWEQRLLNELIHELSELETRVASVESRHQFALEVDLRSRYSEEARDDWQFTLDEIKEMEIYQGLELTPQRGLVPLGANPKSGLFEFWHLESGDCPVYDESKSEWVIDDESGIIFVLIPGAETQMGSWAPSAERSVGQPYVDRYRQSGDMKGESPVHAVRLSPFFLSKYEMTQGQWNRALRRAGGDSLRLPITNVSWHQCDLTMTRLGLTLPTEAQWEYACRARTTSPHFFDGPLTNFQKVANIASREVEATGSAKFEPWLDGFRDAAPVGSFAPNPFGLCDVYGNVWEWCRDCFLLYEFNSQIREGDGLREGEDLLKSRCLRGGSFLEQATTIRSSAREGRPPEEKLPNIGLRPARPIDSP